MALMVLMEKFVWGKTGFDVFFLFCFFRLDLEMLIKVSEGLFWREFLGKIPADPFHTMAWGLLGPYDGEYITYVTVCKNFYEGTPINLHYPLLQHDEFFTMYKSPHKDLTNSQAPSIKSENWKKSVPSGNLT